MGKGRLVNPVADQYIIHVGHSHNSSGQWNGVTFQSLGGGTLLTSNASQMEYEIRIRIYNQTKNNI